MENVPNYKISKITKIKSQTKYLIQIENFGELICSEELLYKFKLLKNKILNDSELQRILKEQKQYDVKNKALNYVSYKPRTEYQVKQKLFSLGFNNEDTEFAIQFLKEFGYLDDRAYAQSFSKDYLKRNPSGKRRLAQELKKRGININIIQEICNSTYDSKNTYSLALQSAQKKLKSISYKSSDKQKNSLVQYLLRQGFEWDTIKYVLEDLNLK